MTSRCIFYFRAILPSVGRVPPGGGGEIYRDKHSIKQREDVVSVNARRAREDRVALPLASSEDGETNNECERNEANTVMPSTKIGVKRLLNTSATRRKTLSHSSLLKEIRVREHKSQICEAKKGALNENMHRQAGRV